MAKDEEKISEILFKKNIKEDIRPWGKFRSYPHQQARSIKIITVNPGQALSLQYHLHRSEFWASISVVNLLFPSLSCQLRVLSFPSR